jgi:hypothetical protein
VTIHSLKRSSSLPIKALLVRAAKLCPGMIAAVNRERVMLGVFSEQLNNFWGASSPVPWDEGDVGTKIVSLHQG